MELIKELFQKKMLSMKDTAVLLLIPPLISFLHVFSLFLYVYDDTVLAEGMIINLEPGIFTDRGVFNL